VVLFLVKNLPLLSLWFSVRVPFFTTLTVNIIYTAGRLICFGISWTGLLSWLIVILLTVNH